MKIFEKLNLGLSKTRQAIKEHLQNIFTGKNDTETNIMERLEETLISTDIGVKTSRMLISKLEERKKSRQNLNRLEEVTKFLKDDIREILTGIDNHSWNYEGNPPSKPYVIMVIGVNGVGKTTTIGKLASKFRKEGKKVVLAAGDTFRAAAIDQLDIWAKRSGAEIIKHKMGSDPSAVVFDAISAGMSRSADLIIVDTAGRLHTKYNLMEEMKKMKRVMEKGFSGSPHEILLVLDAVTGQNAVVQTRLFNEAVGVTGIALTKLDGSAKGGIVVAIADELNIPIKLVGVGEGIDDLISFKPEEFVNSLFDI